MAWTVADAASTTSLRNRMLDADTTYRGRYREEVQPISNPILLELKVAQ